MTQTLSQLEHHDAFIARHIGPSAPQQADMLAAVGSDSLAGLLPKSCWRPFSLLRCPPRASRLRKCRRWPS